MTGMTSIFGLQMKQLCHEAWKNWLTLGINTKYAMFSECDLGWHKVLRKGVEVVSPTDLERIIRSDSKADCVVRGAVIGMAKILNLETLLYGPTMEDDDS